MGGALDSAMEDIKNICAASNGSSSCFLPGAEGYRASISHWLQSSSARASMAVQPGSAQDVARIIKVLAEYRIPFAVKCGGHATSPGISSVGEPGIQIHLARLQTITNYRGTQTVDIGAGCTWDQVYNALNPWQLGVVGGSASEGVGVSGWLLGGGYSLKSNKYGLGIDNIVKFEVVLPSGKIVNVSQNTDNDLFISLKGGGNNFGIVTQFTLKTHFQGLVSLPSVNGTTGNLTWNDPKNFPAVENAIADFATNEKRPEAAISAVIRYRLIQGVSKPTMEVFCYYDGPKPTNDPFKNFRSIPGSVTSNSKAVLTANMTTAGGESSDSSEDNGDFTEMSYAEFDRIMGKARHQRLFDDELDAHDSFRIGGTPTVTSKLSHFGSGGNDPLEGLGILKTNCGRWDCIMLSKYTSKLIATVTKEAQTSANKMKNQSGNMVLIDIWPFLPTIFDQSNPAAWPHKKGDPFFPCIAIFWWDNESDTNFWILEMKRALAAIHAVALQQGATRTNFPIYMNTTLDTTPVADIYRSNLKTLSSARAKYDPYKVMDLAAGFRIPYPVNYVAPLRPPTPIVQSFGTNIPRYQHEGFQISSPYTPSFPIQTTVPYHPHLPLVSLTRLKLAAKTTEAHVYAYAELSNNNTSYSMRTNYKTNGVQSVGFSWLELPLNYPEVQWGRLRQKHDRGFQAGLQGDYRVNFPNSFTSLPTVHVFLNEIYINSKKDFLARATCTNIDLQGFTIRIADSGFNPNRTYRVTVTWIAYPPSSLIFSGVIQPPASRDGLDSGRIDFKNMSLSKPPAVFGALSSLMFGGQNYVDVEFKISNISQNGMDWRLTYGGNNPKRRGGAWVTYIVFCD